MLFFHSHFVITPTTCLSSVLIGRWEYLYMFKIKAVSYWNRTSGTIGKRVSQRFDREQFCVTTSLDEVRTTPFLFWHRPKRYWIKLLHNIATLTSSPHDLCECWPDFENVHPKVRESKWPIESSKDYQYTNDCVAGFFYRIISEEPNWTSLSRRVGNSDLNGLESKVSIHIGRDRRDAS